MNLNTKGQLALKNHWQLYWKKLQWIKKYPWKIRRNSSNK